MVRRQTGLNEGGGEGAPDPNKARWIGLDCDEELCWPVQGGVDTFVGSSPRRSRSSAN